MGRPAALLGLPLRVLEGGTPRRIGAGRGSSFLPIFKGDTDLGGVAPDDDDCRATGAGTPPPPTASFRLLVLPLFKGEEERGENRRGKLDSVAGADGVTGLAPPAASTGLPGDECCEAGSLPSPPPKNFAMSLLEFERRHDLAALNGGWGDAASRKGVGMLAPPPTVTMDGDAGTLEEGTAGGSGASAAPARSCAAATKLGRGDAGANDSLRDRGPLGLLPPAALLLFPPMPPKLPPPPLR